MVSSLYIHIPFCIKRCIYCDFVSGIYDPERTGPYLTALKKELSRITGVTPLNTLYIGGGTPTALSSDELSDLVHHVLAHFGCSRDYEATIEANPGTVDREKLTALMAAGINRLSIGVQSLKREELAVLGRIHSCKEAEESVMTARDAGFGNIGVDLIYGIPGQDLVSWSATLEKTLKLRPQHISTYELTVEKGTGLFEMLKRGHKEGLLTLPDEERIVELYKFAIEYLTSNGYVHYEISNFARPGFLCRHNINYWNRGEYFGAGLGAHSFAGNRRYHNTSDPEKYIRSLSENRSAVAGSETINREKAFSEAMFLGLRKTAGIYFDTVSKGLGPDVISKNLEVIQDLQQEGLTEFDTESSRLRLTDKGRLLSNEVFARFL